MKTREELLQLVPRGSISAEIGVFKGEFSKLIFETVQPKELYLVDLFEGQMCSGDKNGNNIVYINLEDAYNELCKVYSNTPNVKLFRGTSSAFLNQLPDNYLDFIYIDGDHSYVGVNTDLTLAKIKVKQGGIIAGHDYCDMFTGVMQAVDEFTTLNNFTLTTTSEDRCKSYFIINN